MIFDRWFFFFCDWGCGRDWFLGLTRVSGRLNIEKIFNRLFSPKIHHKTDTL